MKLGIVLLNWNGGEFTIPCIESLLASTRPPWRIVVVDNASIDSSPRDIERKFPEVALLREKENLGFAGGNNKGIKYLLQQGADAVWVLNNDTIVDTKCIQTVERELALHPDFGVLTTRIFYADPADRLWYAGGAVDTWRYKAVHWGENATGRDICREPGPVSFVSGCSMIIRPEVLRKVGLFHEKYFIYYEDMEWCLRAAENGILMQYVPDAVIQHRVSATQNKNTLAGGQGRISSRTHYLESRNRLYTIRLHARGLRRISAVAFYLAHNFYLTAGLLAYRRWDKLRALWRGFYHGTTDRLDGQAAAFSADC